MVCTAPPAVPRRQFLVPKTPKPQSEAQFLPYDDADDGGASGMYQGAYPALPASGYSPYPYGLAQAPAPYYPSMGYPPMRGMAPYGFGSAPMYNPYGPGAGYM